MTLQSEWRGQGDSLRHWEGGLDKAILGLGKTSITIGLYPSRGTSKSGVVVVQADQPFSGKTSSNFSLGTSTASVSSTCCTRPRIAGFLLPLRSRKIDLTVWAMVLRPCQSGKMPTQPALKKSHMMPTVIQP